MKYDLEERVLFGVVRATGVTVDRAYSWMLVRIFMRLSAILGGNSVKRPR